VWYAGEDSVLARVRMALDTPEDVPARWIAQFAVDPDLGFDATVALARRLGARLRFKPYRSALGRVAVLADPLGTRFAVIDPDDSDESEYGSVADDPYDD
jgi:predicted enzyme related to lactoylglutathione lyase